MKVWDKLFPKLIMKRGQRFYLIISVSRIYLPLELSLDPTQGGVRGLWVLFLMLPPGAAV